MNRKKKSSEKKRSRPGSRHKNLTEAQHKLHAQIGRLEEFIASSPFHERREKLATRNIIPPPERTRTAPTRTKQKRMSRRHQMAARQERHRHLLHFFCLFLVLCAMLYWLFRPAFSM